MVKKVEERLITKKFLKDITEDKQIFDSPRNFDVSEPSNFAANGRSYYSRPKDWKEKHDWVRSKLEPEGYTCKGSSSWNSTWSNGIPTEEIKVDYWEDFDVIKEIIEMSIPIKARKTEAKDEGLEKLAKELNAFLLENGLYEGVGVTYRNDLECRIVDGDWKHQHWRFKHLIDQFFGQKGIGYDLDIYTEPSDQDCYTATYIIEVEDFEFLTESVENDSRRVSIAFDAEVAANMSEKDIEAALIKALKSVNIQADSYFEIHSID